jgi:hypothetical protein
MSKTKINLPSLEGGILTSSEVIEPSLSESLEDSLRTVAAASVRPTNIVTVKPIRIYNRKEGSTQGVSILPGAKHVMGTITDGYGVMITGITEEEYAELKISKEVSYKDFFKPFKVILTDAITTLDLSREQDYLKYRFLLTRPEIAKTPEDTSAKTRFVLYDEEEEAKKLTVTGDKKMEAYIILNNMSFEDQLNFLKLFGHVTKGLSPTVVKGKLITIVEKNASQFLTKFNDKNRADRIFLESLIQARILDKRGTSYYYNEELLGATEDITIQYLKNPKNNDLRINLLTLLKASV